MQVSVAGAECKVVPREVCGAAVCPLVNEPECRIEVQTVSWLVYYRVIGQLSNCILFTLYSEVLY